MICPVTLTTHNCYLQWRRPFPILTGFPFTLAPVSYTFGTKLLIDLLLSIEFDYYLVIAEEESDYNQLFIS